MKFLLQDDFPQIVNYNLTSRFQVYLPMEKLPSVKIFLWPRQIKQIE